MRERLHLRNPCTNRVSVLHGALLKSAPAYNHSLTVVAPFHGRFSPWANDINQNWESQIYA